VKVFASSPVTFTSATVTGSDAENFPISGDNCSGHTLAAGEACSVSVGFEPHAIGDAAATLRLIDGSNTAYDVALQGSDAEPAPTNLSVSQDSRYVTASWTLPDRPLDVLTGFLEFASDPDTDADGFFTDPDTIAYLFDSYDTTFDSTPDRLPPGTYYVHVSGYDNRTCDQPTGYCRDVFSTPPVKLVVPPDPVPPSSPPPAASGPAPAAATLAPKVAADTATAFAALKVPSRQRASTITIHARLAEAGTITAGGVVSVPKQSKVFRFKPATARVVANVTARLHLNLPAKALKAVKKALRRGKKLKAKINITATDEAGNRKTERRTVSLKP
jgi:hypothetical protein